MAHYSMPVQQPFHSVINLPNLERKAEEFVAIHCIQTQTNYLCRDQPKTYFEDVMANHNGIMKPVIKDGGGHPNNPINNKLSGLFFMVRYSEDESTVFGPRRFILPTRQLIEQCNIYFSDFYCLRLGRPHYVQIVLARPYTPADVTCRQLGLVKLDPYNNPFIKLSLDGVTVQCAESRSHPKNVWIEVFCAEEIDVNKFVSSKQARFITVASHGGSRGGVGRTRSVSCSTCE